jgi:hypothetical protein
MNVIYFPKAIKQIKKIYSDDFHTADTDIRKRKLTIIVT